MRTALNGLVGRGFVGGFGKGFALHERLESLAVQLFTLGKKLRQRVELVAMLRQNVERAFIRPSTSR